MDHQRQHLSNENKYNANITLHDSHPSPFQIADFLELETSFSSKKQIFHKHTIGYIKVFKPVDCCNP